MTTLAMLHEIDPRTDLQNKIGDVSHIKMMHNNILVATYIRPKQTAGKIILLDSTRKEDEYQGKVGMVIAKGPLAFKDDERNQFHGQDVHIGEWVGFGHMDGRQLVIKGAVKNEDETHGGWHCRILQDIDIKSVISHPDALI